MKFIKKNKVKLFENKINPLYVRRRSDRVAERAIDDNGSIPYHYEDSFSSSTIYVSGLSKVGKKELATQLANHKSNKVNTCHIVYEINNPEKKEWFNVINEIKSAIKNETGFNTPLSDFFIGKIIEGNNYEVEIDKVEYFKRLLLNVIFLIVVSFLFWLFLKFSWGYIEEGFTSAAKYIYGFVEWFRNIIYSFLGKFPDYIQGFVVAIVSPLAVFLFSRKKISKRYINSLGKKVGIKKLYDNDKILDSFSIEEVINILRFELSENLLLNNDVYFICTLKLNFDDFSGENYDDIYSAIKCLVDIKNYDDNMSCFRFLLISKRYNVLKKLDCDTGKYCDLELFSYEESFEYIVRLLCQLHKDNKLKKSPVLDLWNNLNSYIVDLYKVLTAYDIDSIQVPLNDSPSKYLLFFEYIMDEYLPDIQGMPEDEKNIVENLAANIRSIKKILLELSRGADINGYSGSLPFDLKNQLEEFEYTFRNTGFSKLEYNLLNYLKNHSSQYYSEHDIEYILEKKLALKVEDTASFSNQCDNVSALIKLWRQLNSESRLETVTLISKEDSDNYDLLNTVCLLVETPNKLHQYINIKLNNYLDSRECYLSLNNTKFLGFKSSSKIFNDDISYGFIKEDYKRYILFDNTHKHRALWGIRKLFSNIVIDFERGNNLHFLPYASELFQSIFYIESLVERESNFNQFFIDEWQAGIFSHESFSLYSNILFDYYFDIKKLDDDLLNDYKSSIRIFCTVIIDAMTRKYYQDGIIDNNRHFCYLLRYSLEENSALMSLDILIQFLKINRDSTVLSDIGFEKYFYRVYRERDIEFSDCFSEFKKNSRSQELNPKVDDLKNEIVSIVSGKKLYQSTHSSSITLPSSVKQSIFLSDDQLDELNVIKKYGLNDLYLLKEAYYIRYNSFGYENLYCLFEGYLKKNNQMIGGEDLKKVISDEDFYIVVSSLRKIANAIAYHKIFEIKEIIKVNAKSISELVDDGFILDSSSDWDADSDIIELVLSANSVISDSRNIFVNYLADEDLSCNQRFIIVSQYMTLLIYFEKELKSIPYQNTKLLSYSEVPPVFSNIESLVKASLVDYMDACSSSQIIESEIRKKFEKERRESFVHINHPAFVSLMYNSETLFSYINEALSSNELYKVAFYRVMGGNDICSDVEIESLRLFFLKCRKECLFDEAVLMARFLMQCMGEVIKDTSMSQSVLKVYLGSDIFDIIDILFSLDMLPVEVRHQISIFCFSLENRYSYFSSEQQKTIRKRWAATLIEMFISLNDHMAKSRGFNTGPSFDCETFDDITDCFSKNCSDDSNTIENNILSLLASVQTFYLKEKPLIGQYFVASIIENDENKDYLLLKPTFYEDIPDSSFEYEFRLPKTLVPIVVYHKLGNIDDSFFMSDKVIDEYLSGSFNYEEGMISNNKGVIGSRIIVAALGKQKENSVYVTARGPFYSSPLFQLFLPYTSSWEETASSRSFSKKIEQGKTSYNWSGDYWLGASNSIAAIRLQPQLMSFYLFGGGMWPNIIENIMGLRRVIFFPKSSSRESMILHFINNMYSDLVASYNAEDRIVTLYPDEKIYSDPRKLRTFISMFKKVFSDSIVIDQENQRTDVFFRLMDLKKKWESECYSNLNKEEIEHIDQLFSKSKSLAMNYIYGELNAENKFSPNQIKDIIKILDEEYINILNG